MREACWREGGCVLITTRFLDDDDGDDDEDGDDGGLQRVDATQRRKPHAPWRAWVRGKCHVMQIAD